jgi:type IV secretory pathway protease TraF
VAKLSVTTSLATEVKLSPKVRAQVGVVLLVGIARIHELECPEVRAGDAVVVRMGEPMAKPKVQKGGLTPPPFETRRG